MENRQTGKIMGVVVVSYASSDVIFGCLDSLMATEGADLRVIVVDNASPDETVKEIEAWGAGQHSIDDLPGFASYDAAGANDRPFGDFARVTLLRNPINLGFAGGVNVGLRALQPHGEVEFFWVLNPDSEVMPDTAAAYVRRSDEVGAFSLMGGRTLYHAAPQRVQSDGGRVKRPFGICQNLNQGQDPQAVSMPDAGSIDFISGSNMVASRAFMDRVGPMQEDYFLFYEEVDWAFRRGDLPLALCPEAVVLHHGGTSTGAGSVARRASAFTNYFNYRNQMRFVRRFAPLTLPLAYAYAMARIARLLRWRAWDEAGAALRGLHGLPPPVAVRQRVAESARALAFGR